MVKIEPEGSTSTQSVGKLNPVQTFLRKLLRCGKKEPTPDVFAQDRLPYPMRFQSRKAVRGSNSLQVRGSNIGSGPLTRDSNNFLGEVVDFEGEPFDFDRKPVASSGKMSPTYSKA